MAQNLNNMNSNLIKNVKTSATSKKITIQKKVNKAEIVTD